MAWYLVLVAAVRLMGSDGPTDRAVESDGAELTVSRALCCAAMICLRNGNGHKAASACLSPSRFSEVDGDGTTILSGESPWAERSGGMSPSVNPVRVSTSSMFRGFSMSSAPASSTECSSRSLIKSTLASIDIVYLINSGHGKIGKTGSNLRGSTPNGRKNAGRTDHLPSILITI